MHVLPAPCSNHLAAELVEIRLTGDQDAVGGSRRVIQERQLDVLGRDAAPAEVSRCLPRQLERPRGAGRKRQRVQGGGSIHRSDQAPDVEANMVERDVLMLQRTRWRLFWLEQQSEQEMLGPNPGVPPFAGFLLGEGDEP